MDGGDKKNKEQTEEAGWHYRSSAGLEEPFAPANTAQGYSGQQTDEDAVEWSASEFVAHEKNFGWYGILALVTIATATVLYFATRDTFTAVVVVMMGIILGVAAARKPRIVKYRVDNSGITVGRNFHSYKEYKSFAMPQDGPFASVVLVPMKRFGFPLSAYLAPDSQNKALEVLANHLPMERGDLDTVEQIMRQLRF